MGEIACLDHQASLMMRKKKDHLSFRPPGLGDRNCSTLVHVDPDRNVGVFCGTLGIRESIIEEFLD